MFKNVASQKLIVFAFDATTNVPKTGDAANITAYVSKDYGTVTVLGDTSATEMDATNAPGYYLFDLTQGETNGDTLLFSGKSSTANIKIIGAPAAVFTYPTTGILAPATSGRTLVVDASGLADSNMVKAGPTGSGTAQTAGDIFSKVTGLTFTVANQVDVNVKDWAGAAVAAPTVAGFPRIDIEKVLGTTVSAPTAGAMSVNVSRINNIAATTVDTVNAKIGTTIDIGFDVGNFVKADVEAWRGTAVSVPTVAGVPNTNVKTWNDLTALALPLVPTAAGRTLDVSAGGEAGIDWANVGSPTTTVGLSGTTIGTVTDLADNAINLATFASDVGNLSMRSSTATAGGATTITLDAGASASNNFYNNTLIMLTGGTGVGQSRFITAYNGTTKVATVATWVTNPDNTSTFSILPFDAVAGATAPTVAQIATGVWQDATAGDFTTASSIGKALYVSNIVPGAAGGHFIAGTNAATTITTGLTTTFTGNLTGSVASVTGAVGSVTGLTASNLDTTVSSRAATGDAMTLTAGERNSTADAILARSLAAQSYAADGAVPTLSQVLYLIQQSIGDFDISGTTLTVHKLDGTTSAATYTLDSATTPTSRTRAT